MALVSKAAVDTYLRENFTISRSQHMNTKTGVCKAYIQLVLQQTGLQARLVRKSATRVCTEKIPLICKRPPESRREEARAGGRGQG